MEMANNNQIRNSDKILSYLMILQVFVGTFLRLVHFYFHSNSKELCNM